MYLFTAGHFPVYSVAEHGPTDCLVSQLLPLLYKTHASGHMCGHDHNLQVTVENLHAGYTFWHRLPILQQLISNLQSHIQKEDKLSEV